jgi:hypothetical protein
MYNSCVHKWAGILTYSIWETAFVLNENWYTKYVKYVRCLSDTVYQDSSSIIQLFHKELSTFYCFTLLQHVNYVKKLLIYFYAIFDTCSPMMIPCGLKHVAILSVIYVISIQERIIFLGRGGLNAVKCLPTVHGTKNVAGKSTFGVISCFYDYPQYCQAIWRSCDRASW